MIFVVSLFLIFTHIDEYLLASIISAECSICPEEEQYLVGSTVLNRVEDSDYPNTMQGVIYEENQFHGVGSRWFKPTSQTRKVARNLMKGEGRDYDVFFFYLSKSPPNRFTNKIKPFTKHVMKYHTFTSKINN